MHPPPLIALPNVGAGVDLGLALPDVIAPAPPPPPLPAPAPADDAALARDAALVDRVRRALLAVPQHFV